MYSLLYNVEWQKKNINVHRTLLFYLETISRHPGLFLRIKQQKIILLFNLKVLSHIKCSFFKLNLIAGLFLPLGTYEVQNIIFNNSKNQVKPGRKSSWNVEFPITRLYKLAGEFQSFSYLGVFFLKKISFLTKDLFKLSK